VAVPSRYVALSAMLFAVAMTFIDQTIVAIASPSIQTHLSLTRAGTTWAVNAYLLALAATFALGGRLADVLGSRRMATWGILGFAASSALCGATPTTGLAETWLIVFRALQGVSAAVMVPAALAIVVASFPVNERGRALALFFGISGGLTAIGPIAGGVLTQWTWRSIFWINVPIGALALVLAGLFVPESRAHHARRVDPVGQVLVILVLAGVIYAIIEGHRAGWASAEILLSFGLAGASLGALLWYEPRRVDPLIELGFFRSVPFTGATVAAVCAFGAFGAFLFLNTLYLQDIRHLSAVRAGVETVPMALLTSVCAPLSGRLVAGYGARPPLLVAGCGMCASALLMTRLGLQTSTGYLLLGYVVFGIGFGMVNAPITNTAVSGMPRAQAGVAAAVASTSRQVGLSLGVAVAGSLLGPVAAASSGERFVLSARPAWWVIAGAAAVVAVVGLLSTSAAAQRTAYAAPSAADQPGQVPGGSGAIAH
jgi:EmrB/QacA subfamily drug resistance transporter